MTLASFINELLNESDVPGDGSITVPDRSVIGKYLNDLDFPFLVSFPRTGSHWLRMLMELYYERPSLVRIFYYFDNDEYIMLHTHDLDLTVERRNVLYLYREPVGTIYSQMAYHHEEWNDHDRIVHWADLYGRHLEKWLLKERHTMKKTVLTYEGMKRDLATEFQKVTAHFGAVLDREKLRRVEAQVTKDEVKMKTMHDSRVVQLNKAYAARRDEFAEAHGTVVWETLLKGRRQLKQCFEGVDGL